MKGLGEGDIAPTGRCGGGKARIYIVGQVQEVKIPCSMGLHSNIQCHTYVRTYIHKMGAHKESNTCVHVNIHVRMYEDIFLPICKWCNNQTRGVSKVFIGVKELCITNICKAVPFFLIPPAE